MPNPRVNSIVKLVDPTDIDVQVFDLKSSDRFIYYGEIKGGGRPPRDGSFSDNEMMVYYDKQKELKYIRYV